MIDYGVAMSLALLFVLYLLFRPKKYDRHKVNQDKAQRVIDKINSFQYDGQKINYLRKIDPFVFEELLLTCFERNGFKIKRNKRYTGDGGVTELFMMKRAENI